MAKKKGKSGGNKGHKTHRSGGGKKQDLVSIVTNQDVIIGAVAGIGTAFIVDAVGSKFVPNIHARNAMKAIVPAVGVQMIMKNNLATMVAAGVGLALGLGSYAESMVKQTIPQTKGVNTFAGTAGMIGEDVYTQTNGDVIEMSPSVSGAYEYEPVYNVNGDLVGKRSVSKGTAVKPQGDNFPRKIWSGDRLAGSPSDVQPEVTGELGSDLSGSDDGQQVTGSYFLDQTA
jgi:hypothetical protein